MTKPAVPPPARSDVIEVEIDAMDLAEWENGQSTPQASDANLAELVRRTAATPEVGVRLAATRERTRTQIGAATTSRTPSQGARTAPPGPAPKPSRARAAAEGSASPRPADAAAPAAPLPAEPAGPAKVVMPSVSATPSTPAAPGAVAVPGMAPMPSLMPALGPAPMPGLPPMPSKATPGVMATPRTAMPIVTTSAMPSKMARSVATPPGGIDFSLPVTATGESGALRLPAPPVAGGIDFSLPVTATGEPARTIEPRSTPSTSTAATSSSESNTASGWTDFDLPVTSIGERTRTFEPRAAPAGLPRSGSAPNGIDFAVPVTATSQSGARRPDSEPKAPAPTPSVFAEASHVGPGRNASPAGGVEPNTAWPPRPRPVDVWSRPD